MVETDRSTASIENIDALVASLPKPARRLFDRIFNVSVTTGYLNAPESMHAWINNHFGSVEAVESQKIVKISNLITFEGSLFNELRSKRPMTSRITEDFEQEVQKTDGDPFCKPEEGTPSDSFGRVRGEHCITASNVAKYDGFHGLVIFDEHNPLVFNRNEVVDYITTGQEWAEKAHEREPDAKYFFFMWNCLWKAGASIAHGHAQVTLSKGRHYSKVEWLRQASLRYQETFGTSYFDDLYSVHKSLGLAWERDGVQVISYLTPIKEKETLLVGPSLNGPIKNMIYDVLSALKNETGTLAFNLATYLPPIAPVDEDWSHFPVVVRIVDRGDPMNRTSDIGAMELYADSVIATDPFKTARALRASIGL